MFVYIAHMGVYSFNMHHVRPLVAIVGAHGATDLATSQWPQIYTLCCFAPLPSPVVTGLFVASSIVHFAEDMGPNGSLTLHSIAGFLWLALGAQRGLEFMLAYLSCVHTPAHYIRCLRRRRWTALVVAAVFTMVALGVVQNVNVAPIGHATQRLVIAHVWTDRAASHCVNRDISSTIISEK